MSLCISFLQLLSVLPANALTLGPQPSKPGISGFGPQKVSSALSIERQVPSPTLKNGNAVSFSPGMINSFSGGVGNTGGGNDIEANFVTKLLAILENIVEFSSQAKAKLDPQINPDQILMTLKNESTFKALCAVGPHLDFIKANSKMAYVFVETPNVVSLNCELDQRREWNRLFQSDEATDSVLFLHEILRVVNIHIEDENAYVASSSYATADRLEKKLAKMAVTNLIYSKPESKCKFSMTSIVTHSIGTSCDSALFRTCHNYNVDNQKWNFSFIVDGNTIHSHTGRNDGNYSCQDDRFTKESLISNILDSYTAKGKPSFASCGIDMKSIYQMSKEYDCQ